VIALACVAVWAAAQWGALRFEEHQQQHLVQLRVEAFSAGYQAAAQATCSAPTLANPLEDAK
jgi:hypothetical protein